jgi:hypothetical protein
MEAMPWWDVVELRDEVTNAAGRIDDVQVSLFNAVHGVAGDPTNKPPYASPTYYGEITHPTGELVGFMAQIAVRLGGEGAVYERAKSVWRLDQAMGGGKSHGLIGLWHLATSTPAFASTDLGKVVFAEASEIAAGGSLAADLNRPGCVVLSCDNMTPGVPDPSLDGPARTLWERFLWRLFDTNHAKWDEHRKRLDKDAVSKALREADRPVLVLIDEIMDWVQKATSPSSAYDGIVDDMAFMRALLDAANDVPNVSVVIVMIASDKDNITLSDAGENVRRDLDDLLHRNGHSQAVTSGGDFAEIIRRRLFQAAPSAEVLRATTDDFLAVMKGSWGKEVYDRLGWATPSEFRKLVARSYPFHPALIYLAEQEWSQHAGFQKVRSTIQIFAAAAYAQAMRGKNARWSPALIGPGDLPLSSGDVREALLGSGIVADQRTVSALREIASAEIANPDDERGTARQLDLNRDPASGYVDINPRVAERMATALFVYSLAPREQGRRGATEYELKAAGATTSNGFGSGDAELVLTQLRSPDEGLAALEELPGKGGQSTRLLLSTRQTLNMFVRALKVAVTDPERDEAMANAAWDLTRTGPFKDKLRVQAGADTDDPRSLREILEAAGIDDARSNRLVVLDPRRFSLLNGMDPDTRAAIQAVMGLGENKLAVGWASSAVFACVNTQRRAHARGLATEFLARERALEIDAVRADEDLLREAKDRAKEARERFEKAVRNAFQHVIYLGEDADGNRADHTYRFDKEGQSALDGSLVWAALVEADKAYGEGEFDTKALLHQLRSTDWGRPLSEIRDAFWNTPRLPLLPGGEEELRRAIFQALHSGQLLLVDKDGAERRAITPAEVNLGSSGIRIEKPRGSDPGTDVVVPDVVGKARSAARVALNEAGLVADGEGDGTVATQDPAPGTTVAASTGVTLTYKKTTEVRVEHQLAIAKTTAVGDAPTRDSLRTLLMALQNAVGDGDVSHISLNVQVVVTSDVKDDLVMKADVAGIDAKVTDL